MTEPPTQIFFCDLLLSEKRCALCLSAQHKCFNPNEAKTKGLTTGVSKLVGQLKLVLQAGQMTGSSPPPPPRPVHPIPK